MGCNSSLHLSLTPGFSRAVLHHFRGSAASRGFQMSIVTGRSQLPGKALKKLYLGRFGDHPAEAWLKPGLNDDVESAQRTRFHLSLTPDFSRVVWHHFKVQPLQAASRCLPLLQSFMIWLTCAV